MGQVNKYNKQLYKKKNRVKDAGEFKFHSKKYLRTVGVGLYSEIMEYDIDFVGRKVKELSSSHDVRTFVKDGIHEHLEREDAIVKARKTYPTYLSDMKSKIDTKQYSYFITAKKNLLVVLRDVLKDNSFESKSLNLLDEVAHKQAYVIQSEFRLSELKEVVKNGKIRPDITDEMFQNIGFEKSKKN